MAKFSTVFGTVFPKRPISMVPIGCPPTSMSKKTLSVTTGPLAAEAMADKQEMAKILDCISGGVGGQRVLKIFKNEKLRK